MQYSVIVPLLNEREQLPKLVAQLRELVAYSSCEIILVDGGSSDGSAEIAAAAGLRVIQSQRGRALQMNAGASVACGSWLLFLHADTRLPQGALSAIASASVRGAQWGRFNIRISGDSLWFPLISTMINWRSRLSGIATGDQAIFVRRSLFNEVGGYARQPLMEDIELSRQLLEIARPHCLRQRVTTSGRRWQKFGIWRTVLLMWRLRFDYWRGVPAECLAKRYE
ncbi:TIGR04283 family arsenosugar biosynthesis glycosyltransferase [Microbulbifer variabilis]|uniref:TIGR04283 family arsenosugar biosynthesis glycosyltransferase n=1 Tax=Microbulbifer variabilis TaxID=266805 RepID=A0ABY4V8D0_9GAMM|nr:TIGR04283 family arsenosugar biosynthesis glycosyltransferase [Microbulbifer variabilis]USD20508.1 TIGR04283 family arsenosugar biosynthesis glycosyltransferase [Microbulbifer variabilis]